FPSRLFSLPSFESPFFDNPRRLYSLKFAQRKKRSTRLLREFTMITADVSSRLQLNGGFAMTFATASPGASQAGGQGSTPVSFRPFFFFFFFVFSFYFFPISFLFFF